MLMHHPGLVSRAAIFASLLVAAWGCSDGFAQGSMGGTIGKEDKSVSGTRGSESGQPEDTRKPRSAARRAPARGGEGGSVSRFDGRWTFIAAGCGAGTKYGVISGGAISSSGGSGQVSSGGSMRASFTVFGKATVAVGRLSGATGTGTYTRVDGCKGPWTAIRK
jgi:hypothetical protein